MSRRRYSRRVHWSSAIKRSRHLVRARWLDEASNANEWLGDAGEGGSERVGRGLISRIRHFSLFPPRRSPRRRVASRRDKDARRRRSSRTIPLHVEHISPARGRGESPRAPLTWFAKGRFISPAHILAHLFCRATSIQSGVNIKRAGQLKLDRISTRGGEVEKKSLWHFDTCRRESISPFRG